MFFYVGLASRYTSYVAVDPKEQKEMKESWMMMKSRDVPVQLAHACGGYQALGAFADGCDVVMNISADVCDVTMGITDDSCSDYSTYCFQEHLRTFLQITTGNVLILFEII